MSRKEPMLEQSSTPPLPPLEKPRTYLDYSFVRLVHAVAAAPPNARTADVFQGKEYLFFVERGWFCIECRKTGTILDLPPAQVLVAQRVAAPKVTQS